MWFVLLQQGWQKLSVSINPSITHLIWISLTPTAYIIQITTTTARYNRKVYIWPPNTNMRYMKKIWHACVILFIIWELFSINFGIGGVVADPTSVAILRIIRIHLDVFITTNEFYTSSVWCCLWGRHFCTQVRKRSFQSALIFRWSPTRILRL